MNPLANLNIKPIVSPYTPVKAILATGPTEIKMDIQPDFDFAELKQRLIQNKMVTTTIQKRSFEKEKVPFAPIVELPVKAKKVKVTPRTRIIIEESDEEKEEEKEEKEGEVEVKIVPREKMLPKKRITKKVEKGVMELGSESIMEIGDTSMSRRFSTPRQIVNYKLPSYYMNNREIFINSINSLFRPYLSELGDDSKAISCDTIGQGSGEFTSLTHQKIITDYMNLYTPYRGLLLYHGLGSGKTCTSIGVAEGMKSMKRIIIMTPASLRRNYMEEIKKCGDLIYKKKQFWEWIDTEMHPEYVTTLSNVLNLSQEFIRRRKGAWLVNVTKESNYETLTSLDKKSLDAQLDEMIESKYTFINYNGLRMNKLKELTADFERNLFDGAVVIIDEAHNFISRIVNKISKEKEIVVNQKGETIVAHKSLFLKLYDYLLSAQNARVVLLTGTPIVNYPNEIGILFNILRGYIKTLEIPVKIKTSAKVSIETLQGMFEKERSVDYLDYSASSKKLFVTKNPLGFTNKLNREREYQGVSVEKEKDGVRHVINTDYISDAEFEDKIVSILKKNGIDVTPEGITVHNYKALPDKLDDFINRFIDFQTSNIKNIEVFKRRILGLTSYFRSAQEGLLPRYEKTPQYYHVVKVPMSDFQFRIYEDARASERKLEKVRKTKVDPNGVYIEAQSTYRIFSRMFCNFVMPMHRPLPKENGVASQEEQLNSLQNLFDKKNAEERVVKERVVEGEEVEGEGEGEGEGEEESDRIMTKVADDTYNVRIQRVLQEIKERGDEILSPEGLQIYSPKFLHILENIIDRDHLGLHLVYSQFRTIEGIELFSMTLNQNGFARFAIRKNSAGIWEINIKEEDLGKPTYALYTGTESDEEKEIIIRIYNGAWDQIPSGIADQLRDIARNNNMGEIIKVFMITSSGSEGINLRNTRYVHIMDPYWHPVRIEQVIGRARRICSHKELPPALQTVEVFIYLMTFTKEQIDSSIELKLNDISKRDPSVVLSSDEYLLEIATIKEELNSKLIRAIKESAIDCAIYSGKSNEGLRCMNFGEPTNKSFTYKPSVADDPNDTIAVANKEKITWKASISKISGVEYASRKISSTLYNIYDLDSYNRALQVEGEEPRLIGTVTIDINGKKTFKTI